MSTTDLVFYHTCDWLPPSAREHQPTLIEVRDYFRSLSAAQQSCMSEIFTLLKLVMLIPGTNSVSEWSASAVHTVKIYLRSTMTQLLFNNLLVLHVHKERTDTLQVTACLNEFVTGSGLHCLEHSELFFMYVLVSFPWNKIGVRIISPSCIFKGNSNWLLLSQDWTELISFKLKSKVRFST